MSAPNRAPWGQVTALLTDLSNTIPQFQALVRGEVPTQYREDFPNGVVPDRTRYFAACSLLTVRNNLMRVLPAVLADIARTARGIAEDGRIYPAQVQADAVAILESLQLAQRDEIAALDFDDLLAQMQRRATHEEDVD